MFPSRSVADWRVIGADNRGLLALTAARFQAASRQKRLEKQMASDDWIRKPPTPGKKLRFRFPAAPRMGDGYAVRTYTLQGYPHMRDSASLGTYSWTMPRALW